MDSLRIPLGTLSPLVAGDSLVVLTGSITFVDFRTGECPIFGAGTRLRIPPVKKPKPPDWVKRIENHIIGGMHDTERDRIAGSVRWGQTACWPESVRYAPGIPIVLEWTGVAPDSVLLRVCTSRDSTEIQIVPECSHNGTFVWNPAQGMAPGVVTWDLLDPYGERMGGGSFEVLTAAAAATERDRFRRAAAELFGTEVVDLTSAVLAEEDRACIW